MKRKSTLLTTITLALGLSVSSAQAETNMIFGTYASPTSATVVNGFLPFLDKVNETSGGDIAMTLAGGGSVVTAKTTLFGLKDGLIDAAYVPSVYYPAELPVSNVIINLGALLEDVPAAIAAMTEMYLFDCKDCMEEDKKWNMRYLGSWSLTNYDLLCTKPVRTAEDVKGLRIRAAGHTVALAKALGASPINVPSSEIYEVLQRGQVDCVFAPPSFLSTYSLGELAKYVVNVNAGTVPSPHNVVIREDLWDSLSEKDRQTLIDAAPLSTAGGYFGTLRDEEKELARADIGYEVIEPDETLKSAINAAAATNLERAIKIGEEKGVENAREIVTKFMASYEKWKERLAGVNTQDEYMDILQKELYSRVSVN
jgi:TRAP-type C4-dicarboxylate transport system substrate-binding protein